MTNVRYTLKGLSLLVFVFALASLAHAQATRTWVSGVGDDVNPCSRTAPCKTFAGAISKTAVSGEIDALDPAGYGGVTITKSITISGTGTLAGVLASGGVNGIVVNDSSSGTPNTAIVQLQDLSIDGAGSGADGIRFISGRRLTVIRCMVFGFRASAASDGMEIAANTGSAFNIIVRDSVFKDNAGDGIRQGTTVGTLNAAYHNVTLTGNGVNGLETTAGTANISGSLVDGNISNGIVASTGSVINADENDVSSNGTGINSSSTVRINGNRVHRNGVGLSNTGTMQSCSNNKVYGNTTDLSGATSAVSPGSCTQ